jgi:SAM-dependent methyltransferase
MNQTPNIASQYDQYFSSRLYSQRYPHPNWSSFSIIVNEIRQGRKKILDFGCGSGRYTELLLEQTDAKIVAYDISQEAIAELASRCSQKIEEGCLRPICGDLPILLTTLNNGENFNLIIMMFGVLGHIFSHALRQETLLTIRSLLSREGRLIVTVPNAARRFLRQQILSQALVKKGLLEPGDIYYQRIARSVSLKMYYHLYSLNELTQDFEQLGFRIIYIGPESVLPESGIVKSRMVYWLDRILANIVPLRYAYGFLVIVEAVD